MKGYTGKILRVNLTKRDISTIDTEKYTEFGGGHGIGAAIFFDLCEDKAISGFDPKNVVSLMTSPISGTGVPSATSRTEITGIGVQSDPIDWFTRSNFGGRFAAMLKFAGWDGIVLEGKAEKPVYLNVINDKVTIEDASKLWGLDTWETQQKLWGKVDQDWKELKSSRDAGRTTQKPAVVAIGPAGENMTRIGALVHDAGNGAGQGGFGGVLGSKNLKAISVLGTGSVEVADPNALLQARIELQSKAYNVDDPNLTIPVGTPFSNLAGIMTRRAGFGAFPPDVEDFRASGCTGCYQNCRKRRETGRGNESTCVESCFIWFNAGGDIAAQYEASDLDQKLGLNVYPLMSVSWLIGLVKMGILGPGKQIDTKLPIDKMNTAEFYKELMHAIAYKTDIGADLSEGFVKAAKKWGREEDLETGLLATPNWGYPEHYDPRSEVEWSYGSILTSRDINDHGLNFYLHWMPTCSAMVGIEPPVAAEKLVTTIAKSLVPYKDPQMLNYSEEGIYSDGKVKMLAWHLRYHFFWKNSILYCDWAWPHLFNMNNENTSGFSPEAEPKFYNAVTGQKITFEDGMEIGRKIWNLTRSIHVLQGRHRDLEVHAGYVYKVPSEAPAFITVEKDGKWSYDPAIGRTLNKEKFEDWKTRYFKFEGWDPTTGYPTRKTLEEVGLKHVANALEKAGKIGSAI